MKKWLAGIMLTVFLVVFSVSISANYGRNWDGYNYEPHRQIRDDAGYIIHRTMIVISFAQQAAEYRHHYFGLGRAIAHQQKARELYWNGYYREAIYHSLRARDIAFQVLAENRERPRSEFYRDDMEERYHHWAPDNRELDFSIDTAKVGSDDAVVHLHFGLDINQ